MSFTQQVISALDSLDVALKNFQQELLRQDNFRRTADSTAAHAASTMAMEQSTQTATPTAIATKIAPSSTRALQWNKEAQVTWTLFLRGEGAQRIIVRKAYVRASAACVKMLQTENERVCANVCVWLCGRASLRV